MYRVIVDERSYDLESVEQLEKWYNSGKVFAHTLVVDPVSGRETSVVEFLENPVFFTTVAGYQKEDPDQLLERQLAYITSRPAEDFTEAEFERLQQYMDLLKEHDKQGLISWEQLILFRKHLRKIAMEIEMRERLAEILEEDRISKQLREEEEEEERQKATPIQLLPDLFLKRRGEGNRRQRPERPEPRPYRQPREAQPPQSQQSKDESASQQQPAKRVWFFHSPMIIFIALVFFTPLGLVLLWTAPRLGLLGSIFIRIVLTFMFLQSYFIGESDNLFENFRNRIEQDLGVFTQLQPVQAEFGTTFVSEPEWQVSGAAGSYPAGQKIYYLLRHITCNQPTVTSTLLVLTDDGYTELEKSSLEWDASYKIYTNQFVPKTEGTYLVKFHCGEKELTVLDAAVDVHP